MKIRLYKPSPALVIALIALFVALGGTAGAVVTAAVPLAKRALVADTAKVALNAKKLEGQSAAQVIAKGGAAGAALAASTPGPASTANGTLVYKTFSGSVAPITLSQATLPCDAGQKVVTGGYNSTGGFVQTALVDGPINETTWQMTFANFHDTQAATVTAFVVCMK